MLLQAFDDFVIECRKLADLILQNLFHVIFAEFAEIIKADKPFAVLLRHSFLDELEK